VKFLDRLRPGPRGDSALLFDALRRAQAERDASRVADVPIANAVANDAPDDAGPRVAPANAPFDRKSRSASHPPRHRGLIALLVVAAILCAAVAWRGVGEREHPGGLKIDSDLDLRRVDSTHKAPPPGK
jgi:hypothetical protein